MADKIDDGGPAFPGMTPMRTIDPVTGKIEAVRTDYDGMSLRDYFAAAALTGFLSNSVLATIADNELATGAYRYADAMLRARKNGGAA